MNTLTDNSIARIAAEELDGRNLHATTIAYIRMLLKPYAEVIDTATSEDALAKWIAVAFSGELAENLVEDMRQAVESIEQDENDPTDPEVLGLMTAKTAIIEYLVNEIVSPIGEKYDTTIYPWDVQSSISEDPELSKLLNITPGDNKLPVTVMVAGNKQFTHMLTSDFVAGLLLFSSAGVGNHDFHVTMFEVPFTSPFVADPKNNPSRYYFVETVVPDDATESPWDYILTIHDHQFRFKTVDFMQGFATGASWINVDHHLYWNEIIQFASYDVNHPEARIRLTF